MRRNQFTGPEPIEQRFHASYEKTADGCWIWRKGYAGGRRGRYGQLRLPDGSGISAHRLSYQLHYGAIPSGMCICHRCDMPACVNPDHLFLGTYADNNADRDRKGRRVGRRKLTSEQIAEIVAAPMVTKELAARYPVDRTQLFRWRRKDATERAKMNLR